VLISTCDTRSMGDGVAKDKKQQWSYIEEQARKFAVAWQKGHRENADAKPFWYEFLRDVFCLNPMRISAFEYPTKLLKGKYGFVDMFVPGKMLVEHKTAGKNFDRATMQATSYLEGIADNDIPSIIVICDFQHFCIYDLKNNGKKYEFELKDLDKNIKLFAVLRGEEIESTEKEEDVNVKAATLMGLLHDLLAKDNYLGDPLEKLLTRILFCLFADDTGIFEYQVFQKMLRGTNSDATDLFEKVFSFFSVLDKPLDKRSKNIPDDLKGLPYVNGKLFEGLLETPNASPDMRNALIRCGEVDWSAISPAIFGSMFQTVMEEGDSKKRRELGAHYTSETNILRLIRPLFMDGLETEFAACGKNKAKLEAFHNKLSKLKFLDPACGCGNFLIIAYRELRLLEMKVLDLLYPPLNKQGHRQLGLGLTDIVKVNVDQFSGIEVEEFPAQVAQVAMWLVDHLMNREVSRMFGQAFTRLPLTKAAAITCGDSLRVSWPYADYIIGNPPFIGHQWRSASQVEGMERTWGSDGRFGRLDYVTCWHRKATDCMKLNAGVRTAFVSTNSICQGEQVGTLWGYLLEQGVKIHFAHRTFQWNNEGRGKAAVHCVIVGFGLDDTKSKTIFEYDDIKGEPRLVKADNINPYLVDAPSVILPSRTKTPEGLPQLIKGSQPTDGGHLILTDDQKAELLAKEPKAEKWLKKYIGGEELINGGQRWCLWLKGIEPNELKSLPEVMLRVAAVAETRKKSPTLSVREFSAYSTIFTQDRQPNSTYLAIPKVSSEKRKFIPIGYLPSDVIASDQLRVASGATVYHFGILCSSMHNAWTRAICGRMKSDYRYEPGIYNNFPWPQTTTEKQIKSVMDKAQKVLDARIAHPKSTLADLYDPLSMPADLVKAHKDLDKAVDDCYSYAGGKDDAARVTFLFKLYGNLMVKS
jgi:hypothetical protein